MHAGGAVREANKRFNSTGHSYEITLNAKCDVSSSSSACSFILSFQVEPATDRFVEETAMKLRPIKLTEIKSHANECVDVVAVVRECNDAQQLTSKQGKNLTKRDVLLVDDSMVEVRFTLWEEAALDPGPFAMVGSAVAIKGASVREFNGRPFSIVLSVHSCFCFRRLLADRRLDHVLRAGRQRGGPSTGRVVRHEGAECGVWHSDGQLEQ